MKNRFNKIITSISAFIFLFIIRSQSVLATVTFDSEAAKADIKNITDPIANVILISATPMVLASLGLSFMNWNTKDDEEKEQRPFQKIVKIHIIAFIIYGLSGAILKWFSIS